MTITQLTSFDHEEVDRLVIGAGIIPITKINGEYNLLLGKERYINHWRGSCKWSGFEGGRKSNEDIQETAAREFIEESLCSISFCSEKPNLKNITHFLKNKQYFTCITLCIIHTEPLEKRYHVTYVVEIPNSTNICDDFIFFRKKLVDLQSKSTMIEKVSDKFPNEYPFLKENMIFNDQCITAITNIKICPFNFLHIEYIDDIGWHTVKYPEINDDIRSYVEWFKLRQDLNEDFEEVVSNIDLHCVNVTKNSLNTIIKLNINEEYIEKQLIEWWPVSKLKKVIENGGFLENEMFRAYFIPVLERALSEVEKFCK